MFPHLYDERKAADAAMYLLVRARAPMNAAKLNRLLYLAERESFAQNAEPLTGDQLQVFEKAPILLSTYQRLAGDVPGWEDRISNLANHEVEVRRPIFSEAPEEYFERSTRLSEADISVLDSVWDQFGGRDHHSLADYIHMNCHEWTDKDGLPSTVSHERLFQALGFSADVVAELLARLEEISQINEVFVAA
ncbi:Panacea domain-containing protein [Paraburkholderia bannensis]|uniref:Panacea domain-containing protein n=1 Tax=Paraburkholderia bannensis TaxID=765414 RepID=UPI002AB0E474|nr:Panacea domain-containing protein [Paraburkholderia bannensis]